MKSRFYNVKIGEKTYPVEIAELNKAVAVFISSVDSDRSIVFADQNHTGKPYDAVCLFSLLRRTWSSSTLLQDTSEKLKMIDIDPRALLGVTIPDITVPIIHQPVTVFAK